MTIDFSLIKIIPAAKSYYDFAFRVKKAAMGPYIKQIWGWDAKVQKRWHDDDWENKPPQIILYDGQPIGTIRITNDGDGFVIERFYLLPEYQNQGIGSFIIKDTLAKAKKAGRVTRLAVLKINPALALYQRHGFATVSEDEFLLHMERQPLPDTKSKKYKAVIFDLFGTLVENFPAEKSFACLSAMAAMLGVPPDDFAAEWRKDFAIRMTGKVNNYQAGIKIICQRLGVEPGDAKIDKAASTRFILNQQEVMTSKPGAVEVLKYLKANGYKTALLSNCSMETTTIWPHTELAPFIDVPVMSAVEGIMKPDPRLFQIALDKLAVQPADCLYVADGVGQELTTATKLGMDAILIEAPHTSEYEHDRETWQGPKITSLKDLLNLVK
jgi:putative hydrolase of the HAD superfamily